MKKYCGIPIGKILDPLLHSLLAVRRLELPAEPRSLLLRCRLDTLKGSNSPPNPGDFHGVFGRGGWEAAVAVSRQPEGSDPLKRRQPLPLPPLGVRLLPIGIDFGLNILFGLRAAMVDGGGGFLSWAWPLR